MLTLFAISNMEEVSKWGRQGRDVSSWFDYKLTDRLQLHHDIRGNKRIVQLAELVATPLGEMEPASLPKTTLMVPEESQEVAGDLFVICCF